MRPRTARRGADDRPQSAGTAAFCFPRPAADNPAMTAASNALVARAARCDCSRCFGERDCGLCLRPRDRAGAGARVRGCCAPSSRVLYALKANPHPEILRTVHAAGCGFECVSRAEVERVLASPCPASRRDGVLFTPNFAPRAEYRWALERGFQVTVDNLSILRDWRAALRRPRNLPAPRCDAWLRPPRESPDRRPALEVRRAARGIRRAARRSRGGGRPRRRPARARRQRQFRSRGLARAGARAGGGSGTFPGVRILNLGGGIGVPDGRARRRSTCARSMPRSAGGQGGESRLSTCGSSPVAISWRQPASCSRA